jgi:hypothetical protein
VRCQPGVGRNRRRCASRAPRWHWPRCCGQSCCGNPDGRAYRIARELSRQVSCAKAMHRYWSRQEKRLILCSPRQRATEGRNVVNGKCCMSWAKTFVHRVLPCDAHVARSARIRIPIEIGTASKPQFCLATQNVSLYSTSNVGMH